LISDKRPIYGDLNAASSARVERRDPTAETVPIVDAGPDMAGVTARIGGGRVVSRWSVRRKIAQLKWTGPAADMRAMQPETAHREAFSIVRLAWIATFLAPLLLAALLLCATTSSAAPAPAAGHSQVEGEEEGEEDGEEDEGEWKFEDEEGLEEGEFEDELGGTDCELGEEALAEGQLTPADVEDLCAAEEEWEELLEGAGSSRRDPHPTCLLRSARVHAKTTKRNRLELTIGYTAVAPTEARIEIRAGRHRLGSVSRHLDRRGVIRLTRRLDKRALHERLFTPAQLTLPGR
jgi:hypothetical protein